MAISKRTGKRAKSGRIGDVRAVRNLLNMSAASDLSKIAAEAYWYHIRVQFENGKEKDLLFTSKEILRALKRAKENPEDVPVTSVLRNLLD